MIPLLRSPETLVPRVAQAPGAQDDARADDATPWQEPTSRLSVQLEPLPRSRFLRQLKLETRRSDRSGAPLSVVVVRLDANASPMARDAANWLAETVRETDFVGYLHEDTLAVVLTHTNTAGASCFVKKLGPRAAQLGVSLECGTYPDEIFETLLADRRSQPVLLPLFVEGGRRHGRLEVHAKRILDVVGAATLLALLAPALATLACAIKLSSRGPIIYKQARLGRHGRPFVFYKFRSMRADNDDRIHREYVASLIAGKHAEVNQGDAAKPQYKLKRDPRVTPIGRLIRKTSLDELPQLYNVLKGDMSLVGPRPPIPYEVERYQAWHLRRILEIQPGITGLWQVEGRNRVAFDDMVRLDMRYAREWSLALDLKLLVRTVGAVLRFDGHA
jgi:lipopolysaccharide/colanic/teichoic acid biosynthesis glycosyltransferase